MPSSFGHQSSATKLSVILSTNKSLLYTLFHVLYNYKVATLNRRQDQETQGTTDVGIGLGAQIAGVTEGKTISLDDVDKQHFGLGFFFIPGAELTLGDWSRE